MGRERVRVCVHAGNSKEDIEGLVEEVKMWLEFQVEQCLKGKGPNL